MATKNKEVHMPSFLHSTTSPSKAQKVPTLSLKSIKFNKSQNLKLRHQMSNISGSPALNLPSIGKSSIVLSKKQHFNSLASSGSKHLNNSSLIFSPRLGEDKT